MRRPPRMAGGAAGSAQACRSVATPKASIAAPVKKSVKIVAKKKAGMSGLAPRKWPIVEIPRIEYTTKAHPARRGLPATYWA